MNMLNRADRKVENRHGGQSSDPKMHPESNENRHETSRQRVINLFSKGYFLNSRARNYRSEASPAQSQALTNEDSPDPARPSKSFRLRFISAAIILIVISMAFNAVFNIASLEKLYLKSLLSPFQIVAEDLKESVEAGILYGKRIPGFYNIEKYLSEARQTILLINHFDSLPDRQNREIQRSIANTSVSLALPGGRVIHSTHKHLINRKLPISQKMFSSADENSPKVPRIGNYAESRENYFLTIPVLDGQKTQSAEVVIGVDKQFVRRVFKSVFKKNLHQLGIVTAAGSVLLIILLSLVLPKRDDIRHFPKKRIFGTVILSVLAAQIIYSALSLDAYRHCQVKDNQQKSRLAMMILKQDIEYLLNLNLKLKDLRGLESWMRQKIRMFPELNSVWVLDELQQPYYLTTHRSAFNTTGYPSDPLSVSELSALLPPVATGVSKASLVAGGEAKGFILVQTTARDLLGNLMGVSLDVATIIVICTLFFIELLILVMYLLERKRSGTSPQINIHYGYMRPAAFFFLVGIDISISFIPLHAEQIYSPLFGLSKDIIMGLPISVEFLSVGISLFVSGIWNDRRGWHEPFLCGVVLAGTGELYSWWAPNILHFIISRAIVGIGYGLMILAAQGFVIAYSGQNSKAQALAQFIAGLYAGSICGGAVGAILAERVGYRSVFLIGAILLYGVVGYVFLFMRKGMVAPERYPSPARDPAIQNVGIRDFLQNRIVLSLIFFSSFPASIAVVGFLNYFSPIYLKSMDVSQATIGRVMMVYGISLIYVGPIISRYVDASKNKRYFIFAGCVIGSLTFLSFFVFSGVLATLFAVFLLGLSSCLVIASQSAYLLNLNVTQRFGAGKAIGIFRATSRIGQAFGPVIFSCLIMSGDIRDAITRMGMLYLVTAVLFLLLTFSGKKQYGRYSK
jgi:predicted MFS family arabinose efflux permease